MDSRPRGSICFETQLFNGGRPGAAATAGEGRLRLLRELSSLRVISKPRLTFALELSCNSLRGLVISLSGVQSV
jgi:hypothetical protein